MTNIDDEEEKLHIAMFPWLACGHINPYIELAKLFAQKGHKISFISTPRNIDRLPELSPNLRPLINFMKLPLPRINNLPSDAETTADLPPEKVRILKKAYDLLQEPMSQVLESSKPDWLLYDFVPYWLHKISRKMGIRNAFFSTSSASSLVFVGTEFPDYRKEPEDFMVPPKWVPFPSTIAFRKFEVSRIFHDLTGGDDDVSVVCRHAEAFRGCDVVAVRTCWEMEKEWLHLLEDLLRKPVLPIGLLPRVLSMDDDETDTWSSLKLWLDGQEKSSIVYVAFGTEAKLSQDEITEIALGLELSGLSFFWVLRAQAGSAGIVQPVRIPTGFEERTKGRGKICSSWAPQLKILAHDSVGVFLTHSGWSSVVEALQFARPLVLLACSNEQGLNVRLLEGKKIGYPVPRDENTGLFTRHAVAESLKLVVEKKEGKIYRKKAKEISHVFGDREMQDKYVNDFLRQLMMMQGKHNKVIGTKTNNMKISSSSAT